MARKRAQTYEQHQAAERSKRKRHADKVARVPSMPQITIALGHAARAVLPAERLKGKLVDAAGHPIPGPLNDLFNIAFERLRQGDFDTKSPVTISRLLNATR